MTTAGGRGVAGRDGQAGGAHAGRGGRVAAIVAASVALIVVAVVAFAVGRLSTLGEAPPSSTSAEAGFARDMQTHHQQGVELAMIVRDATDDPDVRLLAYDIATTQSQQSGQLYGWLRQWGLSQAGSEPSMTWMTRPGDGDGRADDGGGSSGDRGGDGHTAHAADAGNHATGAPMPGLATAEQIDALRASSGIEAERRFLELMIAHHEGALEMAEAVLARSNDDVVVPFATSVVASQTSEIALMEEMLAERS